MTHKGLHVVTPQHNQSINQSVTDQLNQTACLQRMQVTVIYSHSIHVTVTSVLCKEGYL